MKKIIVTNKKAFFNYDLLEQYEAGIVLQGCEVKSIAKANVVIDEAFIIEKNKELFIINMYVDPFKQANSFKTIDPVRNRKLMLNKNEILKISHHVKKQGATIVPINLHFSNQKIKMEIAIAKSKNKRDKRLDIKVRDENREIKKYV